MPTVSRSRLVHHLQLWGLAVLLAGWQTIASAQATSAEPSEPTATSAAVELVLPAGTEVKMRLEQAIGSKTHKRGDVFALVVTAPVTIGEQIVIPTGARAEGEIIHAAKAAFSGRAGELIATARRVRVGDREVKLRSFLAGTGTERAQLAAGVGIAVGLPGLFIRGGQILIPAGTEVVSITASDALLLAIPPEPQPENSSNE